MAISNADVKDYEKALLELNLDRFRFAVFNNCVRLTHSRASLLSGTMYLTGGIFYRGRNAAASPPASLRTGGTLNESPRGAVEDRKALFFGWSNSMPGVRGR